MPSQAPLAVYATLPRTTRGVPIVIGGDPKGKNFLYCNGNSVILREIADPSKADIYTEHSLPTNAAAYSPSGFYIASGDQGGKIRIWDTINPEHILKNEFQPLGGAIKDIAWSPDNQRIAVGGEGRERYGHVFSADTGTSVGEIMGHSKALNSVSFKPARPFRLVTASEDSTLAFFHGPPFKYNRSLKDHTRFVNCVRYSPTGDVFISGSSDGHAFIYDGATADQKGELGSPAHTGGIYAVSFNKDGTKVITASGDKSSKIWEVASGSLLHTFNFGKAVEDMQVGCLWQGDEIISVSLSGHINYLDEKNPGAPSKIIKGHNKPITCLTISEDRQTAFTAASDGQIVYWDVATGHCDLLQGKGHGNQVQSICVSGDTLISSSMDDSIYYSSVSQKQYGDQVKMPSQPRAHAAAHDGDLVVVGCVNEIVVLRGRRVVYTHKTDMEPSSVAINRDGTEVTVGGESRENLIIIFSIANDTLTEIKRFDNHLGAVRAVAYSPDGSKLASADANKKVFIWDLPDYVPVSKNGWGLHTAKVNCIAWSPDSRCFATGSLDTNIIIWNPEQIMQSKSIKSAHTLSQVTGVQWLDGNRLISSGQDSNVKIWGVEEQVASI